MTNEEKAREIHDTLGIYADAYYGAMAMAEWKDEQHAKEKQQWIDEAAVYISTHTLTTMSIPEIHNMIVDFKQTMKGE